MNLRSGLRGELISVCKMIYNLSPINLDKVILQYGHDVSSYIVA